ncbi:unnamed protein product [Mucor hiemalis]
MSSIPHLPNEIFAQILASVSFRDQKTCMTTSHAWYYRFRPTVLNSIYIKSRLQFKQLLTILTNSYATQERSFGLLIRRLTLSPTVGMVNAEFNVLPIYCPFLEYFEFNPNLWKYLTYNENMMQWSWLTRYPCMQRLKLTVPILCNTGSTITNLEMSPIMVDELMGSQYNIFSLLAYTPNLKSLALSDGIIVSQNISISEFESIHALCPLLESLQLKSFDAHILSKDGYLVDIETLPIANQLKTLKLDISINSEEFLHYWAHKYPNVEDIDFQLRLLEPEYYRETALLDSSHMKESFALMATRFTEIKKVVAQFDEKYFPCDLFLYGIINNRSLQVKKLEKISIQFYNFDYHRRSAHNFKTLLKNSVKTMKSVSICNWDRSWDYEEDILGPLSACLYLETLSLSPQPGILTEFDIDIILDCCPNLKRLELSNTYNLFVRDEDNVSITRLHRLKEFSLKYTMVNNRLFEYLAVRCPYLNKLDILHMTKPYDNDIQVKINMPRHRFKSIRIAGLRLGLRIEDAGFQCNSYSTICSLEETEKMLRKTVPTDEKWYHLYQPVNSKNQLGKIGQPDSKILKPRLQRLNNDQVRKIKILQTTRQLWEQISFAGSRLKYEPKHKWELDIPYGFSSIRCRSVDEFQFEGVTL